MENLKPIKVKIFYDEELKKITGKDFEEAVVSENLGFPMFLNFVFSSYPLITKKFIPGTLGFRLNGIPPREKWCQVYFYCKIKLYGKTIKNYFAQSALSRLEQRE